MPIFQKAVVDTEPLFSVLLLKYSRGLTSRAAQAVIERSRISTYLRNNWQLQDSIIQLFESVGVILTTSHVVGEMQGFQREKDQNQRDFWTLSMKWLRTKGFDEQLLSLLHLDDRASCRESICRIGPSDAGLLELALREGAVLLTDDVSTLAPRGWEQGIDCKVVYRLLNPA